MIVGGLFERAIEERFDGLVAGLLLGAAALAAADWAGAATRRDGRATVARAGGDARAAATVGLALGAAQAAALVPGVSRSGATLAAARALGYSRAEASELSFGVAGPVLIGATALKAWRGRRTADRKLVADRRGGVLRGHPRGAEGLRARARPAVAVRRRTRSPRGRGALPSARVSTDAYAQAGVDQHGADRAVSALVSVLKTIDPGRASRSRLASGHYAAVLEVAPNLGIAVGTDGVGSKLILAEQTGRYDTVGIDCVAMNVNDVVCVGAEPIALLDYLAVEQAVPEVMEQIGVGLKKGAELAGVEIPGGEVAILPELIRGHPSPNGFDLTATCFGTVALDQVVTGETIAPGDALIGVPSSGLHSNSYTLARKVVEDLDLNSPFEGGTLADALLEPTVIYVRAALDLIRSDVDVRGLAHITGGGLLNLLRLNEISRLRDRGPAARAADHRVRDGAREDRRGRGLGDLQHGLRLRRRGPGSAGRPGHRDPRRAPPRHAPDRHRLRRGRARERRRRALLVRPGLALRIVLRRLVAARRHVRLRRKPALGRGGAGHAVVAAHRLPVLFEV